jgi:hypothetical protein
VLKELLDRVAHGAAEAVSLAGLYFGLKEPDQGFAWLERAVDKHHPQVAFALQSLHDDLRHDPRYVAIRQRVMGE